MIILRQKQYATGVERTMAKEALSKVGKKNIPELHMLPLKTRAKVERFKRDIINGGVDTINNPAGAVMDLGKNVVTRPLNTVGKIAIAVPFPASVPAGAVVIYAGNQINKIKPLKKLSDNLKSKIEGSKVYKKIKNINFGLLKHPYKDKKRNHD